MTHEDRVERIRRQIDELPEEYRLMYAVEWLACAEAESDRNHRRELSWRVDDETHSERRERIELERREIAEQVEDDRKMDLLRSVA
jgi:hypothetical protein